MGAEAVWSWCGKGQQDLPADFEGLTSISDPPASAFTQG